MRGGSVGNFSGIMVAGGSTAVGLSGLVLKSKRVWKKEWIKR